MPQSVSIQTDSVVSTKPTHTKEVSRDNSFSETLDKHINTEQKPVESNKAQTKSVEDQNNKATDKTEKDESVTAEADAKTEKSDGDDGKKLPSDEKVSDKDTQVDDDSESDSSESEKLADNVVPQTTFVVSQTPDTKVAKTNNDKVTVAKAHTAAKKTVIAPAVTETSESKTQSTSSTDANSGVNAANKKQADASLVTVTETEKAVIKQTQNTTSEKVPNFAKALQSMNEADGKTTEIRADIMDAIQRQRQRGDGEQVTSVRNMMAAQAENKDKTDVDLLGIRADKTIQERLVSSTPTTTTSVSSGATSPQTASASTAAASTVSLPVQPNIQSSAWSQVMNSRVVWMAKEGIQQAEMKMNPANLGPVEVKLHVQNDQASVTFLAQHSTTREALEQALPKLRDSFAENGIQLTHAEVGQQQHQQQRDDQPQQMQNSQNFTQANGQSDDIMSEAEETLGSAIEDSGLSLYV
ncbi:flagellar hook-length control protein FliK [Methylophaga sulfidovorans]|uniref:Hook-length control protein FliK n=1 Tax=Methylophaga sulfidovorans TaxID=45496 RepID=A0A1I3WR99_9GAMM|nr:flagellar hook-length control protein FliK [Methylophaga sulfidovorans]SFK09982.1 hook-length control protein FliK [Methylophaga sulfidovorans]